jgi:hypothetical protein
LLSGWRQSARASLPALSRLTHQRGRYWYCHRYDRRCDPWRRGVEVTLTNVGTKVAASTTTSGTGDYTFNLLIPGQYTVTIEAKGFKKLVIPGLALAAGDRLRENANMEPGNVEETVTVSTAAPLLQTDSSIMQSTVTEQSVQDLPLN